MGNPAEKKSDAVRRLVAAGDFKSALRIASNFRLGISPEDHAIMKRGWECLNFSGFYRSIGIDVPETIRQAQETVQRLYGT